MNKDFTEIYNLLKGKGWGLRYYYDKHRRQTFTLVNDDLDIHEPVSNHEIIKLLKQYDYMEKIYGMENNGEETGWVIFDFQKTTKQL